ncbi:type I restriction endonuclease subunit R [Niastella sp. OAS944]|uniref:type I restriction endonuclease subunit R n=1 Tax=Niastella sp. OAS944 TaxID=2664089 RepID=UPI003484A128|nr:type I restriction enzyme R subunit [Chitinophagaceae bacterium OAS944]
MSYAELNDSQSPALLLLRKLGWQYISKEEALKQRGKIKGNVILEVILEQQLKALNSFTYKNNQYKFSDGNIHAAIHAIKNVPDEGLVRTSEKVYDLLTLGKSFEETIQGDRKSFTIKYIDWENPKNNVYHIADEFVVEGINETRRPDLVLFINGIPFAVIENKRRDNNHSIDEAISQHQRNQSKDSGIPKLYHYAQLLLAVHPNEVKYATINTHPKFWSIWEEQTDVEGKVQSIINKPVPGTKEGVEDRLPTIQDRILYCLCRKDRLIELAYKFIIYDGNIKKICRYQQYFTVMNALQRIKEFNSDGQRKGGVVWHTQGSGKSLTMVMLGKCLSLEKDIKNARVIIVTDRIDLDNQITKTFTACQKHPVQAKSGAHLAELINDNGIEVITTIIDKFDAALSRRDIVNESANIFVLVDESHRSQYGSMHAKMRKVLPKACYIGFTGTPLMHNQKSTAKKFGGFILPNYPIEKAVRDKAVVPLLYEGRSAKLSVNRSAIDKEFSRVSEPLPVYQTRELQKKFASITQIYKSQQVVEEIAYDICKHYCENWRGKGFKAMLAVPLRETAIKYLRCFENQINPKLQVNARVIISAPDTREGNEEVDEEPTTEVQKWWDKTSKEYPGGMDGYERKTIEAFKQESEDVELLIVVGKLLTGFDAPNCTILYLAKPLAEHNLLQAIARVNRLYEGKDFGYIIDYIGILGELDEALTHYAALSEFDEDDLEGSLISVAEEIKKLPQRHADLLDVFKQVKKKDDKEALERFLAPKDKRDLFREKLTAFARNLQTALAASDELDKIFPSDKVAFFVNEFKFYNSLRLSVQHRYAEKIDFREYEKRIQKLLDTHVSAEGMDQITEPVNIFNEESFKKEVERVTGSIASKADAIAYATKKVTTEKMEEDPVYYKRFSDMIDKVIQAFMQKRINESQYLAKQIQIRDEMLKGSPDGVPAEVQGKPEARAFYGILREDIEGAGFKISPVLNKSLAQAGVSIAEIISSLLIRDWHRNDDVKKKMMNDMEDYLLRESARWGIKMDYDLLDKILERCIGVAKKVY